MSENECSTEGEAHLNSLQSYLTSMSGLVSELDAFAKLSVGEFGHDQQEKCKNIVRATSIVQRVVGPVTDISERVFDSMSTAQQLQLTDMMNRLEVCNMTAVELVMSLTQAIAVMRSSEFGVLMEGGGGQG